MIFELLTYIQAFLLLLIFVYWLYRRINKKSEIRISSLRAKEMAKEGMANLTGITYKGGALKRFYTEHVETGRLKEQIPAYETTMKKLRPNAKPDHNLLKTLINYTHGKTVEITD